MGSTYYGDERDYNPPAYEGTAYRGAGVGDFRNVIAHGALRNGWIAVQSATVENGIRHLTVTDITENAGDIGSLASSLTAQHLETAVELAGTVGIGLRTPAMRVGILFGGTLAHWDSPSSGSLLIHAECEDADGKAIDAFVNRPNGGGVGPFHTSVPVSRIRSLDVPVCSGVGGTAVVTYSPGLMAVGKAHGVCLPMYNQFEQPCLTSGYDHDSGRPLVACYGGMVNVVGQHATAKGGQVWARMAGTPYGQLTDRREETVGNLYAHLPGFKVEVAGSAGGISVVRF